MKCFTFDCHLTPKNRNVDLIDIPICVVAIQLICFTTRNKRITRQLADSVLVSKYVIYSIIYHKGVVLIYKKNMWLIVARHPCWAIRLDKHARALQPHKDIWQENLLVLLILAFLYELVGKYHESNEEMQVCTHLATNIERKVHQLCLF